MGLFDRFTSVTNKNVTLKNIDKVTDDNVLADTGLIHYLVLVCML